MNKNSQTTVSCIHQQLYITADLYSLTFDSIYIYSTMTKEKDDEENRISCSQQLMFLIVLVYYRHQREYIDFYPNKKRNETIIVWWRSIRSQLVRIYKTRSCARIFFYFVYIYFYNTQREHWILVNLYHSSDHRSYSYIISQQYKT